MSESNNFVTSGTTDPMTKEELVKKIVRIVDYQTSPNQAESVPRTTVLQIATREVPLPAACGAIDDALERERIIEEDGRYRLA